MKKIIIIGAGPAGLTAGYKLLEESENNHEKYQVIIVEADKQVGGISKTIAYKNNRMDLGGHRFFSKNQEIMSFWKQLLPIQADPSFDDQKLNRNKLLEKDGPNPNVENKVMLIRRRISRIFYLEKFFDYPISLKWRTIANMGLIKTLQVGISYITTFFKKLEETSLESFYTNRFGKKLYSMFFEKYTEKVWGRHPSKISADWGAQRVKGVSIQEILKNMLMKQKSNETSLIEQFWYPKFGPGQMWETLEEEIVKRGGIILKEHRVEKINIKNKTIQSIIVNHHNNIQTIYGDIFISSMPLKDLVENFTGEMVPKEILEIATGLPYRDFMTVGLLVRKLKLKNETNIKTLGNIVPDCWIYVQEPNVKLGRIQVFNNWSPYMLEDPEESVWLGLEYFCNENDEYWNMTDTEFINFAINELISMKMIDRQDVLDSHREKVKKAYPAYFDTYEYIDKLIAYLNQYENLYCIGRNGQHRYNNMDHSMLTAIECVKNIRKKDTNRSNIWAINTEKNYCEQKGK